MNHVRPIKILHIASGDLWGGAEVQLYTLAKTLNQLENISLKILLFNHGELERRLLASNISVTVLDESILNSAQLLYSVIQQLKSSPPHVIHTHRTKENVIGGIAAKLVGNIPCIRTTHGAPEYRASLLKPHKKFTLLIDWFVGKFLQRAIVAVSHELAYQLERTFSKDNITVIENGIDIDNVKLYQRRNNLGQHPGQFNVGIAGRLVKVKRIDMFIQIAKFTKDNSPQLNIQYHIFGDGPLETELKELCVKLDIDQFITFEGHCNNILKRLSELDVLIMTSDHEGLPMVLLEAMCLKVPIIAHAVGGIPYLLENGNCGNLIKIQKAQYYGQAIRKILTQPEETKTIVDRALHRVTSQYSSKANANCYYELYRTLSEN